MDKWKYENEQVRNEDMPLRLNVRGDAGWELASLTPYRTQRAVLSSDYITTVYVAVYKRHKAYVPVHKRRKP